MRRPAMKPLEPPDSMHLTAAQGWLELGNPPEANEELEQIAAELQCHPEVLRVRWHLNVQQKKWAACLDIANTLIKLDPLSSSGWVNWANTLYWAGRTQEAFDGLLPLIVEFPKVWAIPYNLACYCAQLGKLNEARTWLNKAFAMPADGEERKQLQMIALADPDLEPLRKSTPGS